jgi:hypothetical protein
MSKTEQFISKEKEHYGKLYSTVEFAIDEIKNFVDKNTLKSRKYYTRQGVLEKYIELLDASNTDSKQKGFISGLFESDKYINLLNDYKKDHEEEINQLINCSKCQCLKCISECKFDSCRGCSNGKHIVDCDHQRTSIYFFDSSKYSELNLVNNNTGEEDTYTILAIIQDALKDKRYIIIENSSTNERFILYYYPRLPEDDYGEISSEEDFNFAAEAYEGVER